MRVLVPQNVQEELQRRALTIAPEIDLVAYSEEGPLPEGWADADAVLRWIAGKRYAELVEHGPHVRWLNTASAGVDHVLTPPVRDKPGLIVTDSGPAFEIAISEFVLAWMLMVTRRLPELLARQKRHVWEWLPQREIYGQTVGIIGLGPIGRGVAARAKAFGMTVLGWRRRADPVASVDEILLGGAGLTRLLTQSDFVVLAAALTDETRTLLDGSRLALMKPSAYLVNIARGALVDEDAMIDALRTGRLGGACLDVFACEPLPPDSPLWDLPNVFVSPHSSSGWTEGLQARQKQLFLDNLARFARGEPLHGVVDIAQGY